MVDRSALIMPRSNRSGRRSPCLHGVDPGDNSTASRQIPFPIRSPASRWPLGGTGDTARAAEGHSNQPGRCQPGSRAGTGPPHLGRAPVPLILPSAPRQFGQSGDLRPGGSRSKTSPAAGAEARGDPTTLRPDGVLAKDRERPAPQCPQNRARGSPHSSQNLARGRYSRWHRGQGMFNVSRVGIARRRPRLRITGPRGSRRNSVPGRPAGGMATRPYPDPASGARWTVLERGSPWSLWGDPISSSDGSALTSTPCF